MDSPVVAERLAYIDFAKRVCVDRNGFSVPPIAMRDPRNLFVPAIRGRDETILRDLKLAMAKNACDSWPK